MQITLTLELTAENLDKMKTFCQETDAAFEQTEKTTPGKITDKAKTVRSETEPVQEAEQPEALEKNPDGEKKTFTLTDIRAVALKLSKAGKSDTLKEIFAKFGATKLSEVSKEYYEELMDALTNA